MFAALFSVLPVFAQSSSDGFNPNANNNITAMATRPDGKILFGGFFTNIAGVARNEIALLNSDGTLDDSFNSLVVNGIWSIVIQPDGKILIGGSFTLAGGIARNRIARLNADGSLDTTFNVGTDANDVVNTIALQPDGKILIGGYFTNVNGLARTGFARVNADGSIDAVFGNSTLNGLAEIYEIVLQRDGRVLVGGAFSGINGNTTNTNIARFTSGGAVDAGFAGKTDGGVLSMSVQTNGQILVAGGFLQLNNSSVPYLERLNANGTLDSNFIPNPNDNVQAITQQRDGKIIAGGNFTAIGTNTRLRIAKITNTSPAFENLTASQGIVSWTRSGTSPQVNRVTFEQSLDGVNYTFLGVGTRIGNAWTFNVPNASGKFIRARGSYPDSSNGFSAVESVGWTFFRNNLAPFDFDGDGKSDLSVFRPSNATWYLNNSTGGFSAYTFGISTDRIVPADYDGDGKTDVAVYRDGNWYLLQTTGGFAGATFGLATDQPVPHAFIP